MKEKIESATDVLKAVLKPVGAEEEELIWPPTDPRALDLMEKVSDFSPSVMNSSDGCLCLIRIIEIGSGYYRLPSMHPLG